MQPPGDWPPGACLPVLGDREAHVWRVALDVDPAPFSRVLADEEIARAARFRFEVDRARFSVTRGTLRLLLGRYLGRDTAALRFAFSEHGKPSLAGERLRFNVAHSHTLALLAFTLEAEIGVDLERTERRTKLPDTAVAVLSPAELRVWSGLPEADQRADFFRHWTAKEAYLKAIGTGLGRDPRTIETAALPIHELDAGPEYAAALSVLNNPSPIVRCYTFAA